MSNKLRYLIVMSAGVIMNIVLHNLASHLGLPMWLDMTGTALAAIILEPAAGLIVGLINNFVSRFSIIRQARFYTTRSARQSRLSQGLICAGKIKAFQNVLFPRSSL